MENIEKNLMKRFDSVGIRSVKTIQNELNKVDSILLKINNSLVNFSGDMGLKLELNSFQSRQKYLIDELSHVQSKKIFLQQL